eukprot:CFRG8425T1
MNGLAVNGRAQTTDGEKGSVSIETTPLSHTHYDQQHFSTMTTSLASTSKLSAHLDSNSTFPSSNTDIALSLDSHDIPPHEERGSTGELLPFEKVSTDYLIWRFCLLASEVSLAEGGVGSTMTSNVSSAMSRSSSTLSLFPPKFMINSVAGKSPMLLFVNPKSGGGSGKRLSNQLIKKMRLHPCQHYQIGAKCNPREGLAQFFGVEHTIVVMGGDGTIGWVMQEMNGFNYSSHNRPAIIVIPLGTGNDLGRTLGCGNGVSTLRGVMRILKSVGYSPADTVSLDQWSVTISQPRPDTTTANTAIPSCRVRETNTAVSTTRYFNNYFSLGLDALVALKFHNGRQRYQFMYNFQYQNLFMYGLHAMGALCTRLDLREDLKLVVDGSLVSIPKGTKSLVLINIPSYAGGIDLWGNKFNKKSDVHLSPQKVDDGLIEVVGISGILHGMLMKIGLRTGTRIAQGRVVKLTIEQDIPAQYDGEPFVLTPNEIEVSLIARHTMYATRSRR